MTEAGTVESVSGRWMIHDIVIGLLAGAGVGAIAGLFVAVRVTDSNLFTLAGAIIGAGLGIYLLMRSHRGAERLINATVVIMWVLLVLSGAYIALLAYAIATFE